MLGINNEELIGYQVLIVVPKDKNGADIVKEIELNLKAIYDREGATTVPTLILHAIPDALFREYMRIALEQAALTKEMYGKLNTGSSQSEDSIMENIQRGLSMMRQHNTLEN